ncbi:hypothetical protein NFI96_002841 [Prochilodus magdalenae]|nr:hypothetical protein NFI96_002841 [Prochilodus magdalenae]
MSGEEVLIPDDRAFSRFKSECCSDEGWSLTYNKAGVTVWIQILEEEKSLHKIKEVSEYSRGLSDHRSFFLMIHEPVELNVIPVPGGYSKPCSIDTCTDCPKPVLRDVGSDQFDPSRERWSADFGGHVTMRSSRERCSQELVLQRSVLPTLSVGRGAGTLVQTDLLAANEDRWCQRCERVRERECARVCKLTRALLPGVAVSYANTPLHPGRSALASHTQIPVFLDMQMFSLVKELTCLLSGRDDVAKNISISLIIIIIIIIIIISSSTNKQNRLNRSKLGRESSLQEGVQFDFGVVLCRLKGHLGQRLVLDVKSWPTVNVLGHPKSVQRG